MGCWSRRYFCISSRSVSSFVIVLTAQIECWIILDQSSSTSPSSTIRCWFELQSVNPCECEQAISRKLASPDAKFSEVSLTCICKMWCGCRTYLKFRWADVRVLVRRTRQRLHLTVDPAACSPSWIPTAVHALGQLLLVHVTL